jgi:hypothetical protein
MLFGLPPNSRGCYSLFGSKHAYNVSVIYLFVHMAGNDCSQQYFLPNQIKPNQTKPNVTLRLHYQSASARFLFARLKNSNFTLVFALVLVMLEAIRCQANFSLFSE